MSGSGTGNNELNLEEAMKDTDEVAVVSCGTSAGNIEIEFYRAWSRNGYDRAVSLFEAGFYDNSHFFRMVPNFLVQFGITYSTDPKVKAMGQTRIDDDPQLNPPVKFVPGTLSYAGK
jgi:cyclophilin family peptidyl-prolyl cis-trans isomerase